MIQFLDMEKEADLVLRFINKVLHRSMRAGPVIAGLAFCLFMLVTPVVSYPENPQIQEYEVKAAFLFNFARLTEWPPNAFASPQSNFVICILGGDPFEGNLEPLMNRTIGGRKVVVKRISNINESIACNLLFIASSEKRRLPEIIAHVRNRPILTVSDMDGFTEEGGMIAFIIKEGRVKFRINLDAAGMTKLNISSYLLEVAEIVRGKRI
ncbi:MAG: YfiR family protein [Dissulfurispiraceae bacterium]|jgi:hypothetical protein